MKVAVLAGGTSAEREVSLVSAANVIQALEGLGHQVAQVDPAQPDFVVRLLEAGPEVVFVALHGPGGEDGSIQGLLEVLGLPYTGSGVLASATAMDKAVAKRLFLAEGIPTPEFTVIDRRHSQYLDPLALMPGLIQRFGFPMVLKPARQGSTIGMTIPRHEDELKSGLDLAFRYDSRVLVECFMVGVEITIGILGGHEPRALPTLEIVTEREMYDYEAKYTQGGSSHIIPARIPEEQREQAQRCAVRAHQVLGCEGMSRVDIIVDGSGQPNVLEVNTVPGLTPLSLLPDAARAAGIGFGELVSGLLRDALERNEKAIP